MANLFMMQFMQNFKRCGRNHCFCLTDLQQKCSQVNNPWRELFYEMQRYKNCHSGSSTLRSKYSHDSGQVAPKIAYIPESIYQPVVPRPLNAPPGSR